MRKVYGKNNVMNGTKYMRNDRKLFLLTYVSGLIHAKVGNYGALSCLGKFREVLKSESFANVYQLLSSNKDGGGHKGGLVLDHQVVTNKGGKNYKVSLRSVAIGRRCLSFTLGGNVVSCT